MKTHYKRLGPGVLAPDLRSMCGRSEADSSLAFVPRNRKATCGSCMRFERAQAARLRSRVPQLGARFTDSAGVSAFYVLLDAVIPGVEVVQAWQPYPIVAFVEWRAGTRVGRMHFEDGRTSNWCRLDTQVAIRARKELM